MSQAIDILIDTKKRADLLRVVNSPELSKKFDRNDIEIARNNLSNTDLKKALAADHINRESIGNNLDYRTEAIILSIGRPVLQVINNTYEVPLSKEVAKVLNEHRVNVEKVIPAVGRIEVKNHPKYSWIATGWLVADDVVVTNRHVALEFAKKNSDQTIEFLYNHYTGRRISASIDIREELSRPDEVEFIVEEVLFISDDDKFDIAFLKVWKKSIPDGLPLPTPIKLAEYRPSVGTDVAVIGYPARDSRSPTPEDMERIFGSIYNVKRIAPGELIKSTIPATPGILEHDCTTLGGNSGGALIDITTGEAVGLHYAGIHGTANLAVSSIKVAEALASLGLG